MQAVNNAGGIHVHDDCITTYYTFSKWHHIPGSPSTYFQKVTTCNTHSYEGEPRDEANCTVHAVETAVET